MIRLARHIEILLLGNECVIVPNLGGFVAHNVGARYDEGEELFLPPLRTLGFNPHLKMNDSLLVQSYVEAYDLGYTEALDAIEDEVRELLRIMGNEGSYELNNLGRLYYDKEGRMNFEPDESGILTPEFYALSSFEMPLLKTETQSNTATVEAEGVPVETPRKHKPRVIYIGKEFGQKTLNISLKAIRNISVAAAVIATVFLVTLPLAKNNNLLSNGNIESGFYQMFIPNSEPQKPNSITPISTQKPAENAKEAAPAKPSQAKEVESSDKAETSSTETSETQDNAQPCWTIVICSHVSKTNADALAEKLKKDGLNDVFVSTEGANKVLYGRFATKEEAHSKLNELSNNEKFKDSWILEVKQ